MPSARLAIVASGTLALAAGAVAWAFAARQHVAPAGASPASQPNAVRQSPLEAQRTKGDPAAPIAVYEASDFQCPYCRDFWEQTLPLLDQEYIQTGKIRFMFLNFPLTQVHPNAAAAHEFAMCAARQNRFWPVHDLLYMHQARWASLSEPASYFMTLVDSAALSRDSLNHCLTTGAVRWLVRQEAEALGQAGFSSTPTFVIEGGVLNGAAPIETWRPILDSIFAAKTAGGRRRS